MSLLFQRAGRGLIRTFGWTALGLFLAAWLGLPWPVYRWLSGDGRALPRPDPDVIVMMGGGGIPSESGLTRAWQAAVEARRHPAARVIVAMPYEPGEGATNRGAVQRELILRGVPEHRLDQEGAGRHTREQAVRVRAMLGPGGETGVVMIVTSPEHVRRSVLAFRRAEFRNVVGRGVEYQALEAELDYGGAGRSALDPDAWIGGSLMLRYRIWDNLVLEIKVLRELAALVYYKARGWI